MNEEEIVSNYKIIELKARIEDYKEMNLLLAKMCDSLIDRINKAKEYIESRANNAGVELMPREKELLKILRGENNE